MREFGVRPCAKMSAATRNWETRARRRDTSMRYSMRTLYVVGFIAGIAITLAASTRPSAAMVIYPWCANYSGRAMGGASSCGSTSLKQCLATLWGNGGTCGPNPWYQPYPPPPTYSPPIRR
jgi:hypothetical protein